MGISNGLLAYGGARDDAGGFSGVFLSNVAVSNAIAIAGGGGGAAYGSGYGGYGGYPNGFRGRYYVAGTGAQSLGSVDTAATQTAGGSNQITPSAYPAQLFGGQCNMCCGGGGWWGGGVGNYPAGLGGGGGSGYVGNVNGASGGIGLTSGAVTSNGTSLSNSSMLPATNAVPGGTTSPYYQSGKGTGAGGTGLVVIIPALGTSPVNIGVTAKMLVT
jgi:hypothetical protein